MRPTGASGGKRRWVRIMAAAAIALVSVGTTGCLYKFSGGGGLPSHINTVFVPPVENETTQFALTELLTTGLLDAARGRLGVQLASEEDADAVIRASITRYSDRALNFQAQENVGAQVFERQVSITARVEIIDVTRNEILWSVPAVNGLGQYEPDTDTDVAAQEIALENLIQKVVDGAQSQW